MPRIVHFGPGAFHRAHQAWYTERANQAGGQEWRITGVSLTSPAIRDRLRPLGYRYHLLISGDGETAVEPVSCIDEVLVGGEDDARIEAALAAPETQVVTLTITEKGYHLAPDGALDIDAPDVRADLAGQRLTIYGQLAAGLRRRRIEGAGPVTVISCDNLSGNGDALSGALRAFLAASDPALAAVLNALATFPNTMVDRITPATGEATLAAVRRAVGADDPGAVATEAFSEWVIEDRFAAGRPDWGSVGAEFVEDVAPFELRKLRMLNGAHSGLAYAGALAGLTFVQEAVAEPSLSALARGVMVEAAETLPDIVRVGAAAYAASLIARFENAAMRHRLRQIAMDGSQKLPVRLVGTWADRRAAGLVSPHLEAAIGAWMDFAIAETAAGRALDDPRGEDIARICGAQAPAAGTRHALAAVIAAPPELVAALAEAAPV